MDLNQKSSNIRDLQAVPEMSTSLAPTSNKRERPVVISAFCILLAVFALFPDAQTVVRVFQIRTLAEFWSWLAELALISIGVGLAITAGLAIWKQQNWGWWLAGIYLGFRLMGSFIALMAISASTTDGKRLYQIAPELLYQPAIIFIVSLSMLTFLYSSAISQWYPRKQGNRRCSS